MIASHSSARAAFLPPGLATSSFLARGRQQRAPLCPHSPHPSRRARPNGYRASASPDCGKPGESDDSASSDDGEDGSPPSLEGRDWREVRAMLQAGGLAALEERRKSVDRPGFHAFPLALPEVGCFLASHPAFYRRNQTFLTQSVVFLVQHDETGSMGFVLNRPIGTNAADVEESGILGRALNLSQTPLADCPVYLGGPDSLEEYAPLAVIHDLGDAVEDSREPLTGVFVSPLDKVMKLVTSGGVELDRIRLMAGCIRWPPGKLVEGVETSEWFAASASKAFALSQCIGLPTPLWKEIMLAMSPLHSKIAKQVYGDQDL